MTTPLKIYTQGDFPSYLPKLNSLYDELFTGGKNLRARLISQVSAHLALSSKDIGLLGQTIEFIHNASLLHDDLVDRAPLRRSKTSAWLKFSPEYAVLAGDYLLARVMVNLSTRGNIQLVQYTSQVISDLLEGEWLQDSLIKDCNVSLQLLDRVHNLKTASLLKWCLRAPFILQDSNDSKELPTMDYKSLHANLEEIGTLLGQLFQRADDLLDFDVRNYENKKLLGDLTSGYFNSFACFLCTEAPEKLRQQFAKCVTIEEVHHLFGRDFFEQKICDFDAENSGLIAVYLHYVDNLSRFLPPEKDGIQAVLGDLPGPLYWRQSP